MLVIRTVAKIKPRDVHAVLNQLNQAFDGVRRRSDRTDDLGACSHAFRGLLVPFGTS